MNRNLIKRHCPTCRAPIWTGLFTNREEIIRCPKCGELLIDNPKKIQTGVIISLSGIFIFLGFHYWIGVNLKWAFAVILVSLIFSIVISNLTKIKKDLVIRNKQTNEISYIDMSEWNDILANSSEKENIFEIIEELK
jgi:uncharacterized protein (DUF983 family)